MKIFVIDLNYEQDKYPVNSLFQKILSSGLTDL